MTSRADPVANNAFLIAPIVVDVLCLDAPISVNGPMTNFSRLPYFDGQRSVNADRPYLSETVVEPALSNTSMTLATGAHLHWTLPKILTQSSDEHEDSLSYPAVPTVWLVRRHLADGSEKSWIVESDYLHPASSGSVHNSISFPVHADQNKAEQPYRYVGRAYSTDKLDELDRPEESDYLPELTATGYGDLSFAAFYPNCHSVFGFYDETPPSKLAGSRYEIFGWYRRADKDFCATKAFRNTLRNITVENFQKNYGWNLNQAELELLAANSVQQIRMVCRGQIVLGNKPATQNLALQAAAKKPKGHKVAIGHTASEALSALLAAHSARNLKAPQKRVAQNEVEDQLELLTLFGAMQGRDIDIEPKFKEARHSKGFSARRSGVRWTLSPAHTTGQKGARANAADAIGLDAVDIDSTLNNPSSAARYLNRLNELEERVEQLSSRLNEERTLLFASWCKYMTAAYPPSDQRSDFPDPDQIKMFIEDRLSRQFSTQENRTYQTTLNNLATAKSDRDRVKNRLAKAILDVKKDQVSPSLRSIAAPRYWTPNEPVLLLTGDGVNVGRRFLHDTSVTAKVVIASAEPLGLCLDGLFDEKLTNTSPTVETQPWNPMMLEWDLEFVPIGELDNNIAPTHRRFNKNFIRSYCRLGTTGPELHYRKHHKTYGLSRYTGRSYLSANADALLEAAINTFIEHRTLEPYLTAHPKEKKQADFFKTFRHKIEEWYLAKHSDTDEFTSQVIKLSRELQNLGPTLAQSLSGFNAALLGHKQLLQLQVADPLGFPSYRVFAKKVADAVLRNNRVAPIPLNDFNPIRTGSLELLHLHLIDSFGRRLELDEALKTCIASDAMIHPDESNTVSLPPRLIPPAKMSVRWIANAQSPVKSSDSTNQESNSLACTSPVCGWLVPDRLNNALLIYHQDGGTVGMLDSHGNQHAAPSIDGSTTEGSKSIDPCLENAIKWLRSSDQSGHSVIPTMVAAIDKAMEVIDPAGFAAHEALAMLVGRPLAIVRVSLNIDAMGPLPINHDWNIFRQQLDQASNGNINASADGSDDGLSTVCFPIRVGEHAQLDDGVVGYWVEDDKGRFVDAKGSIKKNELPPFYAPQTDAVGDINNASPVRFYGKNSEGDFGLDLSLNSGKKYLTMLFDPRAHLHVTSGILPTKRISLPSTFYTNALSKIAISIRIAPIMTPRYDPVTGKAATKVHVPAPDDPEFEWGWATKDNKNAWNFVDHVEPATTDASFNGPQELQDGWLTLKPKTTVAKGHTKS